MGGRQFPILGSCARRSGGSSVEIHSALKHEVGLYAVGKLHETPWCCYSRAVFYEEDFVDDISCYTRT